MGTKGNSVLFIKSRVKDAKSKIGDIKNKTISEKLKISEKHISGVLSGKEGASYALARKIATLLGTTVGCLSGEVELLSADNVMESNVHLEIEEPPVSEDVIEIPVLSPEQTACCGKGIPSAECTYDNKESVQVQKKLIGRMCEGKMPFAIIAEGSSMERWGIEDGSRVVINPVEEVHDFDIVLVCYRDNLALKKVQRRPDGSISLLSADGAVIMVTQEEAEVPALFEIWGKAMYYRQVRAGTIKHGL